jgi:hypothetical protein
MAFTLDLLGEAVITEAEAQSYLKLPGIDGAVEQEAKKWSTVEELICRWGTPAASASFC